VVIGEPGRDATAPDPERLADDPVCAAVIEEDARLLDALAATLDDAAAQGRVMGLASEQILALVVAANDCRLRVFRLRRRIGSSTPPRGTT
jgi:hypothetical protein